MKKGRGVNCIFCDDIRYELGNKFSLIGIYSGEMFVDAPGLPFMLPKLATHIWITTPVDKPFKSVVGWLIGPSGEELARTQPQVPPRRDSVSDESVTRVVLGMMVTLSPLQVSAEGFIDVWVEVDGEKERAGRLSVKLLKPETVGNPGQSIGG